MKLKIIVTIISILLITGCGSTTKTDPSEIIKDIYKGTAGLEMGFMQGAPPEEVYEQSPFQLNLEIENRGAYDIKDGLISIGIEKDYMRVNRWLDDFYSSMSVISESSARFSLEGKSQSNPKGDETIVSMQLDALNIKEKQSEKHESTIRATACYKYQTKLVETVCIDTDVYNLLTREKVCEVKTISLTDQGAPLAVVQIEESMLPEQFGSEVKPEFIIHIENKGNGQSIKDGAETIGKACSSEPLSYEELNLVTVSAFLPGKNGEERQLNCEPETDETEAYIKLRDKKGLARCVLEEGIRRDQGTYLSPLTIKLDYGYMFTISKLITITKMVNY